jgi:NADH-quinone oxidoreductase subunit F
MLHILERINQGEVTVADVNLLNDVASQIVGKCLCPLGEFAVSPVLTSLKGWRADFDAHAKDAKKAAPARPARAAPPARAKEPAAAGD